MSDHEPQKRIGEILSLLLAKRLELSLREVEAALVSWRRGEHDVTAAHAATLRHAARTSAFGARIAKAGLEGPTLLLRDAYDLDLIDAAEFFILTGQHVEDVKPAPALDADTAPGAMPKKREVVNKLLEDGPVLIHLDARRPGVEVPDQFKDDPKLVLRIGHDLTPQIPDLRVDDFGIRCTLTFRGKGFPCRMPWASIYALVAEDGRGLVWPEHVPPEVQKDYLRSPETDAAGAGAIPTGDDDLDDDADDEDVDDGDAPSEPKRPDPPKRGGHLRLV